MSQLPRLISLGDSISIQYGPYLEAALEGHYTVTRKAGQDEALQDLDVPTGANVGDSGMLLRYLRHEKEHGNLTCNVMTLNCGLHDVKFTQATESLQVPIEQTRQNLPEVLDIANAAAGKLNWVRTTPVHEPHHNREASNIWRYNRDVDAVNAIADELCRERDIPMIDLHAFTLAQGDMADTCPDGRHFTPEVQQAQARFIADTVLA